MTEDSMHRTLNAALARNSGPSAEDVEGLDTLVRLLARHVLSHLTPEHCTADCMARALLASDWLAAHTAAAEARGAKRGARAVVEAVEAEAADMQGPTLRRIIAAAREAAARVGGEGRG